MRAERYVPLMTKVYGPDMRLVGVVADVFGPVKAPYISVKVSNGVDPKEYVGRILYFRPLMRRSRRGRRKARRKGRS